MAVITSQRRTYKDTESTTDCYCMRIELTDGTIYRFADSAADLEMTNYNLNGVLTPIGETRTYLSTYGMNFSAFGATSGGPNEVDVEGILGYLGFNITQITTGYFNKARVYIFATDWSNPVEDDERFFGGYFGEVTLSSGKYKLKLKSQIDVLEMNTSRYYTLLCDAKFGSERCGVNLNPPVWVASAPPPTQIFSTSSGSSATYSRMAVDVLDDVTYVNNLGGTSLQFRSNSTWLNTGSLTWNSPSFTANSGLAVTENLVYISKHNSGLPVGGHIYLYNKLYGSGQDLQELVDISYDLRDEFGNVNINARASGLAVDSTTGVLVFGIQGDSAYTATLGRIGAVLPDPVEGGVIPGLTQYIPITYDGLPLDNLAPFGIYQNRVWYSRPNGGTTEIWTSDVSLGNFIRLTTFDDGTSIPLGWTYGLDGKNGILYAGSASNLKKFDIDTLTGYTEIDFKDARIGNRIKPTTGGDFWYRCVTGGLGGSVEPVWDPAMVNEDNQVRWTAYKAYVVDRTTDAGGGTDKVIHLATALPSASWVSHFVAGDVLVTSGPNSGHQRRITANTETQVAVDTPFPYQFESGDSVVLTAGCQKRRSDDCQSTFLNVRNFQGFDRIPGTKKVFARGIS